MEKVISFWAFLSLFLATIIVACYNSYDFFFLMFIDKTCWIKFPENTFSFMPTGRSSIKAISDCLFIYLFIYCLFVIYCWSLMTKRNACGLINLFSHTGIPVCSDLIVFLFCCFVIVLLLFSIKFVNLWSFINF